ncbi:hypothetical protein V6N13_099442 [Hibiscus sabdariffa]|uniref:Uncharacterized protein n=2 Tax=Hibiscus sabdariffa TaxID=183260 RepID=A0ABR2PZN2_9ROSI
MAKQDVMPVKDDNNKEEKEYMSLAKVEQPDNLRHAGDLSEPRLLIHRLGEIMSLAIYKYSILTHSWTSGMTMDTPRCLFGSASLGEIAIVAGGCDPLGNVLDSVELYDSEIGKWMTIPSLNKARKCVLSCLWTGSFMLLVASGLTIYKH